MEYNWTDEEREEIGIIKPSYQYQIKMTGKAGDIWIAIFSGEQKGIFPKGSMKKAINEHFNEKEKLEKNVRKLALEEAQRKAREFKEEQRRRS